MKHLYLFLLSCTFFLMSCAEGPMTPEELDHYVTNNGTAWYTNTSEFTPPYTFPYLTNTNMGIGYMEIPFAGAFDGDNHTTNGVTIYCVAHFSLSNSGTWGPWYSAGTETTGYYTNIGVVYINTNYVTSITNASGMRVRIIINTYSENPGDFP